ncbi:MAG: DUF4124 domain-containing protein [Alcanivorax sp.]|nr:DUF4124 domain-containing protein [Alcanivorax sp.]
MAGSSATFRDIFYLLLCLSLASQSAHARIYTWVDDDGRQHFSQTPPQAFEKQEDEVSIFLPSQTLIPRQIGTRVFCGNLSVDEPGATDHQAYLLMLARRLSEAQRHSDSRTSEGRCRQAWTLQQLERYRSDVDMLQKSYRTALQEHQQLIEERNARCSNQASGWLVGEAAQQWASCHIPAQRRERELQKTLNYLRAINNIHFDDD